MWFIGVEVEQETSAPPPKKILDPPLYNCTLVDHWKRTIGCRETYAGPGGNSREVWVEVCR